MATSYSSYHQPKPCLVSPLGTMVFDPSRLILAPISGVLGDNDVCAQGRGLVNEADEM